MQTWRITGWKLTQKSRNLNCLSLNTNTLRRNQKFKRAKINSWNPNQHHASIIFRKRRTPQKINRLLAKRFKTSSLNAIAKSSINAWHQQQIKPIKMFSSQFKSQTLSSEVLQIDRKEGRAKESVPRIANKKDVFGWDSVKRVCWTRVWNGG